MPENTDSDKDPLAPLSYAPDLTIPHEIQPGVVRHWRGRTGRIYADHDGWFSHPGAARPLSAMAAWFWDGPMVEVKARASQV